MTTVLRNQQEEMAVAQASRLRNMANELEQQILRDDVRGKEGVEALKRVDRWRHEADKWEKTIHYDLSNIPEQLTLRAETRERIVEVMSRSR